MTPQYVLGVDHGSGGCKVTCLDSHGALVSEGQVSYPSLYPQPRWVEQTPEQWIDAAIKAIGGALRGFSSAQRKEVKAIAFTAPHHVGVLLDDDGNVLRNAIMWNDQRSGEQAEWLNANYGKEIYAITNNAPNPTWTLCQFLWLKQHEPQLYAKIRKVAFMKDYVRYRFCGVLATDAIEAEGTLFYDIHKQRWSEPLLKLIDLDPAQLPDVYAPTDICGGLAAEMAEKLGLQAGISVVFGTADTAAEVYGCGTSEDGDGVVKLATAGNFTLVSSRLPNNPKLTAYHHVVKDLFYQNSATNFAAASFRWFKEIFYKETEKNLTGQSIYAAIVEEIGSIPPGAEGLLFQPYLNGERSPHWDPYLRGSFFGLTARHGRAHFARAVLEGVGFSLRDCRGELSELPQKPLKIIGGGSKGRGWVQIMANMLNAEMEVMTHSDASFGAALIAATALGWFADSGEAVRKSQTVKERISPQAEIAAVYDELYPIYRALHDQTAGLCRQLSDFQRNA
ncbi:xylulokinase [Cohnella caldifontis]|uniref:xylulokinase n=1 Tax=Cohnella caldifontis TaxID=3027471 RepID=UPI0023ED518B|nr:xylulokinase [Cohnella sp. YIM B05605]